MASPRFRARNPASGFRLRIAIAVMVLLSAAVAQVHAGTNEGGMLIIHANPSLIYTSGIDYQGYAELYNCEDAVTRIDNIDGDMEEVVYFVMAAFDGFAWPCIVGVEFGLKFSSPLIEPFAWGTSAPFSIASPGWPGDGSGIGMVWAENPLTQQINEICWFVSYSYTGNYAEIAEHPSQGWPKFGDDSNPPSVDRVEGLGRLGFGRDGHNPCGGSSATGACCAPSGRCLKQTRSTCEAYGYIYHGDNTVCWPNPCVPGEGACCLGLDCRLLKWNECLDSGGVFMGEGVSCIPSPCEFSQIETSWSKLKTIYRQDW